MIVPCSFFNLEYIQFLYNVVFVLWSPSHTPYSFPFRCHPSHLLLPLTSAITCYYSLLSKRSAHPSFPL